MKHYSKEVKQKAVDLIKKGFSFSDASKEIKIPPITIKSWYEKTEGKIKKKKTKTYPEELKEKAINEVLNNGKPINEVAKKNDVNLFTLQGWIKRACKKTTTKKSIEKQIRAEDIPHETKEIKMLKLQNEYLKKILHLYGIEV